MGAANPTDGIAGTEHHRTPRLWRANIAAQKPRLPLGEESLKTSKNPCLIKFGKWKPDLGGGGYFCIRHPRADVISKERNADVRVAGTAAGDCLSAECLS